MYFLLAGIIAVALKFLEMGPVATWSWWVVLAPFAMAVAWWTYADASGYTKKKEMKKMADKKQERIDRQREAMGIIKRKGPR